VPEAQVPVTGGKSAEQTVRPGQAVSLKVMEVDPIHHRIMLAVTELGEVPPEPEVPPADRDTEGDEPQVEGGAEETERVADATEQTVTAEADGAAEAVSEPQAGAAESGDSPASEAASPGEPTSDEPAKSSTD
jgi:ribosomal protein S1